MTRWRSLLSLLIVSLSLIAFTLPGSALPPIAPGDQPGHESVPALPGAEPVSLSGWLVVVRSDPAPRSAQSAGTSYLLFDSAGRSIRLVLDESLLRAQSGVLGLDRRHVIVDGYWLPPGSLESQELAVEAIRLDPALLSAGGLDDVTGPQPWVSLLCKFEDVPAEPEPVSYFEDMLSSSYPGQDHYWREQSYDLANIEGSAVAGWYVLPQPRSYYVYDRDGDGDVDLDWGRAADDCTAVADADVYFPDFVGINLMFNDVLDCCAWGGGWWTTLDGVTRMWYMTWEPPWGYANSGVISHEMGHGFGLPHSSGDYGQTYDNQWDVMSDVWSNCIPHPTFGCLGQHTISYHKDSLGWVGSDKRFLAPTGTQATITLEQLALPQTGNYLMAHIPILDSPTHFYTLEARRNTGYDAKLPGQAVIIHDVDLSRDRPAHVIDVDGNGNTGDAGAQWLPGEKFSDTAAGIAITILAATPTGFIVEIVNGAIDVTGLQLEGPTGCTVGIPCPLVATALPITATLPITYTWEATGQAPVTHVGSYLDAISFTWNITGPQLITLTATNGASPIVATHVLTTYQCLAQIASDPTITYTSIQAAVDAAAAGDLIKIAGYCSGIAERDGLAQTVYLAKNVTLRGGYAPGDWSAFNPEANPSTLDAQGQGRVVYVAAGAQPTLEALSLTGGDAAGLGGGRFSRDAGGGLYSVSAAPIVSGCVLYDNTAQEGGGAYLVSSPASLVANTFWGNMAESGGGFMLDHSTAGVDGNLVTGNTAGTGGGIHLYYSPAALSANRVLANSATSFGGGLYATYSGATLRNDVLADNTVGYQGSGLYLDHSAPELWHTTFARNTGGDRTGLYVSASSTASLFNPIVTGHATGVLVRPASSAALDGVLWFANTANTGGGGTVTVQHAVTGDPAFAADGYHITEASAALNAGIDAGVTTDLDGDKRPQCAGPDLGADELVPGLPAAGFASSTPDWLGQMTSFSNNSTGACLVYSWDLGDGTWTAAASPTHTYTAPGLLTVVLTATNPAGSAVAAGEVVVYSPPQVAFSAEPTHGMLPLTVSFAAGATTFPPGDPTLTYHWSFGDGAISAAENPTHTYMLAGLYTVSLTAGNAAGEGTAVRPGYIAVAAHALYLPVVIRQ